MSIASTALFNRVQLQPFAMNNLVQLGDHLSVDHPGIDAQHKAIFELGAKIYDNWRSGAKVAVLRSAIDKLATLLADPENNPGHSWCRRQPGQAGGRVIA